MNRNYDNSVYLDANFLIAYAGYPVKQPLIKKRAKILFAHLLIENKKLVVSPLIFDELWHGIRTEIGPKMIKNKIRFQISKFLNKVGLKLANQGIINFACCDYEIFDSLKFFTKKLLNSENFHIVQFNDSKKGILKALENIKKFKLRPRDAFHLSYMIDKNIKEIVSGDKHFLKNQKNMKITATDYAAEYIEQ